MLLLFLPNQQDDSSPSCHFICHFFNKTHSHFRGDFNFIHSITSPHSDSPHFIFSLSCSIWLSHSIPFLLFFCIFGDTSNQPQRLMQPVDRSPSMIKEPCPHSLWPQSLQPLD
ncbi:hypothetical protein V6Z11_D10G109500 [Gossypium hirsutum]